MEDRTLVSQDTIALPTQDICLTSQPYDTPVATSLHSSLPLTTALPSYVDEQEIQSFPEARPPTPATSPNLDSQNVKFRLPTELSEETYRLQVLQLEGNLTETEYDAQVEIRAESLGISLDDFEAGRANTNLVAEPISTIPIPTKHVRTCSVSTANTNKTESTTHSSMATSTPVTALSSATPSVSIARRPKNLSFNQYDKFLLQTDINITPPKPQPVRSSIENSHSLFSPKGYKHFKEEIKNKVGWKKRASHGFEPIITCICCREDFPIDKTHQLRILPCGHTYCVTCLHVLITQATTDESKMPPRCCIQPIPSSIVKAVLTKEEQQLFLKAVIQFSTPWEARIFCPNTACGEFIPPRKHVDPKHPFKVTCPECRRRVCVMCKRDAHPLGKDCPGDWELDKVLKIGESRGWRRCYKCRNLVELSVGCTHITCRCKAQFCYICGAVWDPVVGCPNFCNGEEELERRQREEEESMALAEAEKTVQEAAAAAERVERAQAERRTQECVDFKRLYDRQSKEMGRFITYEKTVRWKIWLRNTDLKRALSDKYVDAMEKMKERHIKTASHLEDRQVAAEMEFRNALDNQEKSIQIRLKYMEAYCDAEGKTPDAMNLPPRTVTERDRRELGQQYNVRDGMERLHQAKINVLRDRQAKKMEELLERQKEELRRLEQKHEEEIEDLAARFAHEEDAVVHCLESRKTRLQRRWELMSEILRVQLEEDMGLKFASHSPPEWPIGNQNVEYQIIPFEE